MELEKIQKIAKLIRYWILKSTTQAGSGHPTSSLSATDLMAVLMFGGTFRFNAKSPKYANNDRLIFSKGHAAPLFYALWAAAGELTTKDLMTLRKFKSKLEGHPTMEFKYTEAATGSLGQGLSIGVGMALNAKFIDKLPYRTYVILGDSEMAEGSVWEAIQLAAHYKLDNLVGIVDVNRLGQRGETMYGHKVKEFAKRVESFGWETIIADGHDLEKIQQAFELATEAKKPVMIIAKTSKGKGVKFIENKDNWHGKPLDKKELARALKGLGQVNTRMRGSLAKPEPVKIRGQKPKKIMPNIRINKDLATRAAYGMSLARIYNKYPDIVALDAETSNSTYANIFKKKYPKRFFEMYIAEQNMVGAALGFSARGKIPFVSTFAAFFTRAFDQIRMGQYSNANIKFVGSHAGVSIGSDGSSQMGLEDMAMFRSIHDSVVFYPSDPVSTDKLVEVAAASQGIFYIRTTRGKTKILYDKKEEFIIGGSKVLYQSDSDVVTVVGAGVTLHEAINAYKELKKKNLIIRVIDLYSIKPIDVKTLLQAATNTKAVIVVEDHYQAGGMGEAVASALAGHGTKVISLCVTKPPHSGTKDELLNYEEINKDAIIKEVIRNK